MMSREVVDAHPGTNPNPATTDEESEERGHWAQSEIANAQQKPSTCSFQRNASSFFPKSKPALLKI
jgi:hypothetical protein